MNDLFLRILQLAIYPNGDIKEKNIMPLEEYRLLLSEARKQAVDGILLDEFRKVAVTDESHSRKNKLQWIARVLQLEKRNEQVNKYTRQVTDFFRKGGYRCCVLKGQGVALLYPNPKRRRCGDIDLWIEGERNGIVHFMRSKGVKVYDVHLVHATADFFDDVTVEIHFRPSWMYNPFLDSKLQQFFTEQAAEQFAHYDKEVGFAYPTIYFNLVHSMVHINRHIFEEGIGFRQLVDYYYILQHSSRQERDDAYKVLGSVGLKKFVGAVMYVLQQVLLLKDDMLLCKPNPKLGKQLLDSVMTGGNFGKFLGLKRGRNRFEKGLLQWKHNLQLMLPYANEAMWIPVFQVWHYLWRKRKGYL